MKVLRTPDERFHGLEGYDFDPHYTEVKDADGTPIRIHHVDEGPKEAAPILLIHGNPTWAYLYRNFIPKLAAAGHRVIAVDLVGCGRSDKPAEKDDYTQSRHIDWLEKWLQALDLSDITLFCQDWGGTLGLHLVATNFPFEQMLPTGMVHKITESELAAYQAPFPDGSFEAGIIKFPMLIAVQPDNPGVPENRAAWEKLGRFNKPLLTLFGSQDPVTKGGEKRIIEHVPGAVGQAHELFAEASHFLQEDVPEELVDRIFKFIEATEGRR